MNIKRSILGAALISTILSQVTEAVRCYRCSSPTMKLGGASGLIVVTDDCADIASHPGNGDVSNEYDRYLKTCPRDYYCVTAERTDDKGEKLIGRTCHNNCTATDNGGATIYGFTGIAKISCCETDGCNKSDVSRASVTMAALSVIATTMIALVL